MKNNINEFNTEEILETLEDLINFEALLKKTENCYLFRGQFDNEWKLESSYKRWIWKQNHFDKEENLSSGYLAGTLSNQIKFIQDRTNKKKNLLEIFAELQHYGSATLLIDFTTNFWNAAWFAISENNSKPNKFFRIYYFELSNNKIEHDIINLNSKKIYRCPDNIQNGLAQKSYFILDNLVNLEKEWNIKSVLIPFDERNKLLKFLDTNKINSNTIFPGLQGLYQAFQYYSKEFLLVNGEILGRFNKLDQSISHFNEVLKLDSSFTGAYNDKGIVLKRQHKYNEAIENYNKGIQMNPKNNRLYTNKAICLGEMGKFDEALDCFDKALKIEPNNRINSIIYKNKGELLNKLRRYNEAIECFDKSIKINPKNGDSFFNKSISLKEMSNYDEAILHLNKAIEINPFFVEDYFLLADIYHLQNKIKLELECYKEIINIDLNNKKAKDKINNISNN